jgi:hypothetical protein
MPAEPGEPVRDLPTPPEYLRLAAMSLQRSAERSAACVVTPQRLIESSTALLQGSGLTVLRSRMSAGKSRAGRGAVDPPPGS